MQPENSSSFLPDFCNAKVVFIVVLIAELLAIIISFAPNIPWPGRWVNLALISLFIQWVALVNVVLLCAAKRFLNHLRMVPAVLTCYALMLLVTVVLSVLALWLTPLNVFDYTYGFNWDLHFILRNTVIAAIVSAVVLRYFYVQHQWKQNVEAGARARVQALQARIRPHFLFNSMNTIASLTRSNPSLAERTVEDLAELFRTTLAEKERIRLADELDLTRRYLNIEQLRLANRLLVEWELADDLMEDIMVPALILQPLVENSIYHGIEPLTEGGTIHIAIYSQHSKLHIEVTNPLTQIRYADRTSGNRMAQENIRQRLALVYGDEARMEILEQQDRYQVRIQIPMGPE